MTDPEQHSGITYFERHPEELADEAASYTSTGIVGNFFSRLFKPSKDTGVTCPSARDTTAPTPRADCGDAVRCSGEAEGGEQSTSKGEETGLDSSASEKGGAEEKRKLSTRLTAIFKARNAALVDYERSDFRRYWMPDSSGRECYECQERFTAFRRRHHCRLCGQIFCSKCCGIQIPGSLLGYMGDLRLCTYCAHIVVSNLSVIESKSENTPSSPDDQKSLHEMDVSISTIFTGPISWSINSPAHVADTENDPLLHSVVSEKTSLKHDPAQLSVAQLALYDSAVQCSFVDEQRFDVVDDHEPEWVKNIEMTDNVKPMDTSTDQSIGNKIQQQVVKRTVEIKGSIDENSFDYGKKSDAADYVRSILSKDGIVSDTRVDSYITESEKEQIATKISPSEIGNESLRFETIERCFEMQTEKLFLHLFKREGLDPVDWWDIIWTASHRVSSVVRVDMEGRRTVNVINRLHIKRLHVLTDKPSAKVIEGTVCSKSIRHESMPNEIRNASILTLEGSVEYERVNDKLSSIEPIIAQENEYLRNQVERMLSHRPSVVLVERNVAGLAVQMLLQAGVTVVSNIKSCVLQRIASCTGADLMPSLDAQILNQRIGFCPFFRQEKIQLTNGKCKCLLIFAECPPELGCSVLLRGNSKNDLRAAKRILRYAILALYSNNLEVELLTSCSTTLTNRCADCVVCSLNAPEPEPESLQDSFYSRLKNSTLSPSPLIEFGIPFLETSKGRRCSLRRFFDRFIHSLSVESDGNVRKCPDYGTEEKNASENYVHHPFIDDIGLAEVDENAVASYRAFSGLMFRKNVFAYKRQLPREESTCNEETEDVLDPFAHQQISLLFGSYCAKSSNAPLFCVRPWVVNIEYYGTNDMSLGDFLTKYCFNKIYQCPSTNCDLPMMEHSRKLVHRNVCVEITTQNYVNFGDETNSVTMNEANDILLVWHYCVKCKASSSILPLTESIYRLSFARYINYLANGAFAACKINSLVEVRPYHVTFSPLVCAVEPTIFTRKYVAELEIEVQQLAANIFGAMSKQIELLSKYDQNNLCSTCYTQALRILRDARFTLNSTLKRFDPSSALSDESKTIRSNDAVYTQAIDTVCRCRYIIQHAINLWNEQCQHFSQQIRAVKKSNSNSILTVNFGFTTAVEDTVETNKASNNEYLPPTNQAQTGLDFELLPLESPFLVEHHFSLPLPAAGLAAVVVRDITDQKGLTHPDIGSIIAYSLSSVDYNTKRRKQRDSAYDDSAEAEIDLIPNYEHIEVDFADEKAQYYVKIYYAERFHMLRKLLFVEGEDCFIRSLSSSRSWNPQGGKSGASFYRTQDDRFVFKQMSRFEIQSFVKFGPNYFSYISTALTDNKLTTLCKVYGVYRICYKNRNNGQQLKVDVLVMEYLFYRRNVKQVWDLKGSQRNRMASEGKKTADLVLLDENLVKDLWNNQLYIHPHSKAALSMAISNDSHFLSAQHVMDYSLLVGVDETNSELILGIVDYMRTYTLDKKLESWVKIVAIPGAHLPTVISPEMYCTRFSDAIDTYFPVAPDQWTGLGSALPCSDC